MGESLDSMSIRDLKHLEGRLEKGITKIRSKKVDITARCQLSKKQYLVFLSVFKPVSCRCNLCDSIVSE